MLRDSRSASPDLLPVTAVSIYTAASLLHFVHNAIYIDAYPNMPAALTAARVMIAWLAIASVGAVGYALLRAGRESAGLVVVALYAALGFDGLAHYSLAGFNAHTWAMNITIWFEAIAGAVLLAAVALRFAARARRSSPASRRAS